MSHLPLFASSPIFPLTSQTRHNSYGAMNIWDPMNDHNCDDLRQSGGFTQTLTPTCEVDINEGLVDWFGRRSDWSTCGK